MPFKRGVLGIVVAVARAGGLLLIGLAILSLPQMRFLMGRLAGGLGLASSLALLLAGIVWLVGVEVALKFFDQFLSRN
jgi:hypothetical protein